MLNSNLLMLVGDSHGNTKFVCDALALAQDLKIPRILQVGDFGIWPGEEGRLYLNAVDTASKDTGVRFDFIDGNHEDFDQLDVYEKESEKNADGSVRVRPHINWWPRGSVTVIENRSIAFLGGAVSVDRFARKEGKSWWSQEHITKQQLDRLYANTPNPVDIMVMHDAPACIPMRSTGAFPPILLKASYDARLLLDKVVKHAKPKLLCHGHWHLRHYTTSNLRGFRFKTLGVGSESLLDGVCILDLKNLSVVPYGAQTRPQSLSTVYRQNLKSPKNI